MPQGKKPVPSSIAGKTRDELEQLVLGLIKKSKAQETRIEGRELLHGPVGCWGRAGPLMRVGCTLG